MARRCDDQRLPVPVRMAPRRVGDQSCLPGGRMGAARASRARGRGAAARAGARCGQPRAPRRVSRLGPSHRGAPRPRRAASTAADLLDARSARDRLPRVGARRLSWRAHRAEVASRGRDRPGRCGSGPRILRAEDRASRPAARAARPRAERLARRDGVPRLDAARDARARRSRSRLEVRHERAGRGPPRRPARGGQGHGDRDVFSRRGRARPPADPRDRRLWQPDAAARSRPRGGVRPRCSRDAGNVPVPARARDRPFPDLYAVRECEWSRPRWSGPHATCPNRS